LHIAWNLEVTLDDNPCLILSIMLIGDIMVDLYGENIKL
jgi:hypothetical protein